MNDALLNCDKKAIREARVNELLSRCSDGEKRYLECSVPKGKWYLMLKVWHGKKSFINAIKAKCLDCSCYDVESVTDCKCNTCPLFKLRPYQSKKGAIE